MGNLKTSIVIVTYNTCILLKDLLLSLEEERTEYKLNLDIIVVDNNSQDDTKEMIIREFPKIIFVANPENLGPAKGFNRGIRLAHKNNSDLVIVANSDIKPIKGSVYSMIKYMELHPHVDGVCGALLNPDLTKQFQRSHIVTFKKTDFAKEFKIEWIGNFFSLIRIETFKKIGLYDENYYFYNEDLDWIERAKRAKANFVYLPNAPVIHYEGQGRKHNMTAIQVESYRANIYYYKKFSKYLVGLSYLFLILKINYKVFWLKIKRLNSSNATDCNKEIEIYFQALKLMDEEIKKDRPRIGSEPKL